MEPQLICATSGDEQGALWLDMLNTFPEPDPTPEWIARIS